MKISTTALWHNKNKLYWLPVFGTTQSSVWVEWGAWLLEIVVRRRTQRAVDFAYTCACGKPAVVDGIHCDDCWLKSQSH